VVVEFAVGANPSFGNRFHISCFLNNEDGMLIAQCDSRLKDFWLDPATDNEGSLVMRTPWLKPGEYAANQFIHAAAPEADI
jgi:lipopolysaccharide transport system ATP-binding protein